MVPFGKAIVTLLLAALARPPLGGTLKPTEYTVRAAAAVEGVFMATFGVPNAGSATTAKEGDTMATVSEVVDTDTP